MKSEHHWLSDSEYIQGTAVILNFQCYFCPEIMLNHSCKTAKEKGKDKAKDQLELDEGPTKE